MRRIALIAVAIAGVLGFIATQGVTATHTPADKVAASGSNVLVTAPGQTISLLRETIRTSTTADLMLHVTAECSIATDLTTVGNDSQKAQGTVDIWVELDGKPVPVATGDDGIVTFCDQAYHRDTTNFDDEDATIKTHLLTATANGFNWLALNVGNGTHVIEVKALLTETEPTNKSTADASVGKRTLLIEPTHAANDETVTQLG